MSHKLWLLRKHSSSWKKWFVSSFLRMKATFLELQFVANMHFYVQYFVIVTWFFHVRFFLVSGHWHDLFPYMEPLLLLDCGKKVWLCYFSFISSQSFFNNQMTAVKFRASQRRDSWGRCTKTFTQIPPENKCNAKRCFSVCGEKWIFCKN